MHNPESGSFETFKDLAEAMQRQSQATKGKTEEEKKHWRVFSKGERVRVEGVPMVVKNITACLLILRPLTPGERKSRG